MNAADCLALIARVDELTRRMEKLAVAQQVLKLALADVRRRFVQEVNRQRKELFAMLNAECGTRNLE